MTASTTHSKEATLGLGTQLVGGDMAPRQLKTITYTGLRGRDGYPTFPGLIPKWRALECLNVDAYRAGFARKRGGATNIFATTTSEAFTGVLSFLFRHVPTNDPTAAEFWGVDSAATPVVQRLTGGTAWATPTLKDNIATSPQDVWAVSFKGKAYFAYDSTQNRLHCWDPDDNEVRRTGLAAAAAPTVANTGSGSYAATIRYYKQRYVKKSGSTYLLYGELSASVSFTPSGSGTAARVTKAAAISELETHWQLFGSPDDTTYFYLSETAIATTTYDDSTNPVSYDGDAPPLANTYTNWTSVRFLLATDDHLLGAGAWETSGAKYSRVWWSAVTGQITDSATGASTGEADAVIQTLAVSNYADLSENDGEDITALGGPLDGRPIVFKRKQLWRLVPTGIDSAFYKPRQLMQGSGVGCIRQHTVVMAEDAAGRPALYWLSEFGPYRMGADGVQSLVDDVQDLWDTINLAASNVVAHGTYVPALRQIWWWIATGSNNDPNTKIVFDVRLGRTYEDGRVHDGWFNHGGDSAAARCSCLFSNTLGASMSRDLKPHIGRSSGTTILKCDTADLDDAGTTFQAYVDLPDTHFGGIDHLCQIGTPIIVGVVGSHSIAATMVRDYGEETRGATTVAMAAGGSEARTTKVIEGIETADAHAVRVRIGDSAAVASVLWRIDAVGIPVETRESLV